MVAKLVAGWLIVLGLSPFTAPFSTCKVGDVFGSRSARRTTFSALGAAYTELDGGVTASEPAPVEIGASSTSNNHRRFLRPVVAATPLVIEVPHSAAFVDPELMRNTLSPSFRTVLRL